MTIHLTKLFCSLFLGALLLNSCKKVDELAPAIIINDGDFCELPLGESYVEGGAQATDNEDGVLDPAAISIDASELDTDLVGEYKIHYSISDAAGNLAKRDKTLRVLLSEMNLIGNYLVTEKDSAGTTLASFNISIDTVSDSIQQYYFADNFNNLGMGEEIQLLFLGDFNDIITSDDSTSGIVFERSFGNFDKDGSGFDLFYRKRTSTDTAEIWSRFDKL